MKHDIKPKPNRAIYIDTLKRMTPEQRLNKAFELSRFTDDLNAAGIKNRNPGITDNELRQKSAALKSKCHNKNY